MAILPLGRLLICASDPQERSLFVQASGQDERPRVAAEDGALDRNGRMACEVRDGRQHVGRGQDGVVPHERVHLLLEDRPRPHRLYVFDGRHEPRFAERVRP